MLQRGLGGEAAHGMLVLSPKAIQRLESYEPNRPLPKIFRLTKEGRFMEEIFCGENDSPCAVESRFWWSIHLYDPI